MAVNNKKQPVLYTCKQKSTVWLSYIIFVMFFMISEKNITT